MFPRSLVAVTHLLVLVQFLETTKRIKSQFSPPLPQRNQSNTFQTLLELHRNRGIYLRGCKISVAYATSELQCLDICLREPRCASFNLKKVWREWYQIWSYRCQVNSGREGSNLCSGIKKDVAFTYFDLGASRINEVSEYRVLSVGYEIIP